MSMEQVKQQLLDVQMRVNALVALVINGTQPGDAVPVPGPVVYSQLEVARAYDACRPFVKQAVKDRKFNPESYGMPGIQTGQTPGGTPRMTQEAIDRMEADIRALGHSDYGRAWFGADENNAIVDKRYAFEFVGFWVHRQNDGTLVRHYNAP